VRDELSSSPRTWHLPQPSVSVELDGRIVLSGDVPDATASSDLERVAAAVRGVVSVDNRLTVPAT
jgi:osmotically-inducible protein OsmY